MADTKYYFIKFSFSKFLLFFFFLLYVEHDNLWIGSLDQTYLVHWGDQSVEMPIEFTEILDEFKRLKKTTRFYFKVS